MYSKMVSASFYMFKLKILYLQIRHFILEKQKQNYFLSANAHVV